MNSQEITQPRKSKIPSLLLRLIGLALFAWVLTRVDLVKVWSQARSANLGLVLAGISMAVPTVLIRSWRLGLILDSFEVRLKFPQVLLIRLVSTAGGDMLPGRAGEAISIAYLQRAGYGLRDPTLTLILDRLFDFVILAVCAIGGLALIGPKMGGNLGTLVWILLAAAAGFSAAIAILVALRARPATFLRLVQHLIPARWYQALVSLVSGGNRSKDTSQPAPSANRQFHWNRRILLGSAAASLFSFGFLILRGYWLAQAIGIRLSLPFLAACMAITTLLQLIPVNNVLGVGTREVSLVYLFGLVGIAAETTVGFSFLIILALLAQDIIGFILWWRYPVGTPVLRPAVDTAS